MIDRNWYTEYLDRYRRALYEHDVFEQCVAFRDIALETSRSGGKLILAGNGASAAIASHAAGDFTKQAGIQATTFHDPDLITMMANDYGYENWVAESIQALHRPEDAVILISSSGQSANIVNAAQRTIDLNLPLITFSGFDQNNPLSTLGQVNFWLNSRAYNVVENTHSIWITAVIDMLVGSAEYSVKMDDRIA